MAAAKKAVEVVDVVEDVKELVEDTVELVEERASWIVSNPRATALIASLVGVAVGSALTYTVVSKRLAAKYQKIADDQVADVKEHYAIIRKDDVSLEELASKYPDDDPAHAKAQEIIDGNGYTHYNRAEPVSEDSVEPETDEEITVTQAIVEATLPVARNVFESDNPDTYFDFEEELARREAKPNDPHVITKEEFDENETDFDQTTLTYYDGDDVLADTNDQPVDDMDKTVGMENLLRFGHGSGDPRIVYIRNPRLGMDIEVAHSDGKFAKEVLGYDDELSHSDKRRPRRFRDSDE